MTKDLFFFLVVAVVALSISSGEKTCNSSVHKKVFRSPPFALIPGEVQDRFYWIEFPKGHVAVKSFHGEVVDENGNSVPLSEVYVHHWLVAQLYVKSSEKQGFLQNGYHGLSNPSSFVAGNDGICQNKILSQFWGLGAETRHTPTELPYPYGISIGDPTKVPQGYEEAWELNVHAIDTRGAKDPQGCLECRCSVYNITSDRYGKPLKKEYKGGLRCCYEGTRCMVNEGYEEKRTFYLQYTIEWLDWDECLVPVRTYIFDVTDSGERDISNPLVGCKVEYDIPVCDYANGLVRQCVNVSETSVVIPKGGRVVYAVSHQHAAGKGMSLHGQDGRHICTSLPTYGNGTAAGDEAGYIVGMGACYPEPGSVILRDKEVLLLRSNYSSEDEHTGVMGLFYLAVADGDSDKDDVVTSGHGDLGIMWNPMLSVPAAALLMTITVTVICLMRKNKSNGVHEYQVLSA